MKIENIDYGRKVGGGKPYNPKFRQIFIKNGPNCSQNVITFLQYNRLRVLPKCQLNCEGTTLYVKLLMSCVCLPFCSQRTILECC